VATMSKQAVGRWAPVGLFLVLLVSLILRLLYAQVNALSYDEGHRQVFGALAAQGSPPYKEVFVGIPPLALLTMQLGVTLFDNTLGVRYPMMLYSLIGVGAIYWLVRHQAPDRPVMAGLLAAAFLSFNYRYFFLSCSTSAEVPALSLALLSVALVESHRTRAWYGWLVLSGVAFALSLALKTFVVFLPLIIGLQLLTIATVDENMPLSQGRTYIRLVKMGATWLGGALLVIGILVLLYDLEAMFRQVVLFRLALRHVPHTVNAGLRQNLSILLREIGQYIPLMGGALLGLVLVGKRGLAKIWLWPLWLVLAVLLLFLHAPLRPRHSILLLPPLAALSGVCVAEMVSQISGRLRREVSWLVPSVFALALVLALVDPIRALASPPTKHPFDDRHVERLSAVQFVRKTTAPDDCVVVEDMRFALLADRLVPPYLSEVSTARLSIGWLTAEEIIKAADANDCPVLVFQRDTFDTFVPELRPAARSLYSLRLEFSNAAKSDKTTVYAVKMDSNQDPSQVVEMSLGGLVTLQGVDLTPSPWRAGQIVTVSTYWETEEKMDRDYKIFVHIKDAQGRTVATLDHYPFASSPEYLIFDIEPNARYLEGQMKEDFLEYPAQGLIPTRVWIPGNTLKETITITWPDTVPPGDYVITTGMYDEATLERLPVWDDLAGGEGDAVVVGTIQVVH
jgi:hypothetical protein